ncbi:MAG: coenzyme F420-0:L-glutamate ligase [Chloroflexi bacterium]|nr:coenzyme F420-0:L-glutamate ligase [Chloroflexota bacterium]
MRAIHPGDDLAGLILDGLARSGNAVQEHDVLVVAQKAVSKSEGALVDLRNVVPSVFATMLAEQTGKDPRVVETVLQESTRIVRMGHGVLIAETRHGFICANAGVDASNAAGDDIVTILPRDPDESARRLWNAIQKRTSRVVAVIVSDSFGRPWREGSVNVAIGVAGLAAIDDLRGLPDDRGRQMRTSMVAVADELASAAQLVTGETGGTPAAIIRGYRWKPSDAGSSPLKRPPDRDLFR